MKMDRMFMPMYVLMLALCVLAVGIMSTGHPVSGNHATMHAAGMTVPASQSYNTPATAGYSIRTAGDALTPTLSAAPPRLTQDELATAKSGLLSNGYRLSHQAYMAQTRSLQRSAVLYVHAPGPGNIHGPLWPREYST